MTAVTVLSFFVRFLPRYPTRLGRLVPGFVGLFLMYACRKWDLYILPGLFLGGIATGFFRQKSKGILRWGQTGATQVRLEMAAETLNQTLQLLKDQPERFVDTDALIVEDAGRAIPEIFSADGEEVFRAMETEAVKKAGMMSGAVIATGGGVVTRERNYRPLSQNGRIVFLHRDLDILPVDGRPISQNTSKADLYAKRLPLYNAFADVTVENNGAVTETVGRILSALGYDSETR